MHPQWQRVCRALAIALCAIPIASQARDPRPDSSLFDPATDTGRYLSVQDSETFLQGRWGVGFYVDYQRKPLEIREILGNTRFPVVRDALNGTLVGAVGIMDWWSAGLALPVNFWSVYFDPNTQSLTSGLAAPETKQGIGDIRLETKFQLLNIDHYNFGIALVPHFTFPTGRKNTFLSGERWTPGLTLALEGVVADRVWIGFNAGYEYVRRSNQFFAGSANAIIDDQLRLGLGSRFKINDEWAVMGEALAETNVKNAFKVSSQSPVELLAGVQYTPQRAPALRGLGITLFGGSGVSRGVGAPQAHVGLGFSYPTPKIVDAGEGPVVTVEDKIIISQKIHFAFGSAQIRAISYPILDDVAALLQQNPQIAQVRVEGHTDWIGSDAYNQRLSQKRSHAVVEYLVGKGIARDRLVPVGYGESQPLADNHTEEGRAKNRRTEFTVLN